jgi:hypothetical protein
MEGLETLKYLSTNFASKKARKLLTQGKRKVVQERNATVLSCWALQRTAGSAHMT